MSPIGCLVVALFAVLFFVGGIVMRIFQLLGLVRRTSYGNRQGTNGTNGTHRTGCQEQSRPSSDTPHKKKVFSDDEGEYVDYEEVK